MSFTTTASRPLRSSLARASATGSAAVLRREAHQGLSRPSHGCEGAEDVRRRLELELEALASGALDLGVLGGTRAEVGYGGRHQEHVGATELLARGGLEAGGRLDVDEADPGGARQRHVGRDQRDLRAAPDGFLGERDPHATRRAVAHIADGVDRLARAARPSRAPRARPSSAGQSPTRGPRRRPVPARSPRVSPRGGRAGPPPIPPSRPGGPRRAGRSAPRAGGGSRGCRVSRGARTCGRSSLGRAPAGRWTPAPRS